MVKGVGLFLAAWVFDDRQGILTAKLIGTLTEQPQICFVVVVVHTVRKRNRVHDKVIMQAVGIQVGGNDDLKSVAPHSLGKFNADLVSLLWRNLTVLEALKAVVTDNLTRIVPLDFGNHHFISGGGRVAIYTCDKETLLGLILISSVLHYIDHRLQVGFGVFGVGGLFGIFGIVDWVVEPATHIPYLADRHYDDLRGSRYLLRMSI